MNGYPTTPLAQDSTELSEGDRSEATGSQSHAGAHDKPSFSAESQSAPTSGALRRKQRLLEFQTTVLEYEDPFYANIGIITGDSMGVHAKLTEIVRSQMSATDDLAEIRSYLDLYFKSAKQLRDFAKELRKIGHDAATAAAFAASTESEETTI